MRGGVADGNDEVVVIREQLVEGRERRRERESDRHLVDLDQVLVVEQRELGGPELRALWVHDALEAEDDVVRGERLAVVERHARTDAHRPLGGVGIRCQLLCEGELKLGVGIEHNGSVVERDQARLVEEVRQQLGVDGVARRPTCEGDPEGAAALGCRRRSRRRGRRRRGARIGGARAGGPARRQDAPSPEKRTAGEARLEEAPSRNDPIWVSHERPPRQTNGRGPAARPAPAHSLQRTQIPNRDV